MGRIFGGIIAVLMAMSLKFWKATIRPYVLMYIEAENSDWICILDVQEREGLVLARVLYPARVPKHRIPAVLTYIALANTDRVVGTLHLDPDSGALESRASVDVSGVEVSGELIMPLIEHAVAAADDHYPGIMLVIFASMQPHEALDLIGFYPIEVVVNRANDLMSD